MQLYVPDYIQKLVPYVPGKPIEETKRELGLKTVIKLASNENPLGASPRAIAAMKLAMKELHRYPDSSGFHLKQALSRHLKVEANRILLGNGSNDIIDYLIRAFCVAGDAIATTQAAFVAYKVCAQVHGVRVHEVPMDNHYRFRPEDMVAAIKADEKCRLVFIANPNNPTGTYLPHATLMRLLGEIAKIRGGSVLVVLDYAYWEYVTAADLTDPAKVLTEFSNVVVLRTFSKVYGLAGMRVGYGVGSTEVMSTLERIRQPFNINSLALVAAEAALGDKTFVARARKNNEIGKKFWESGLKKLGIPFWPTQGNFILADFKAGTGKSGIEVFQECLKLGVILRPVANYGLAGKLRISFGTPAENKKAMQVLGKVLGSLGGLGGAKRRQ